MTKDPAFLFYPNDYIGGTMGWSFEEKGAYIEILMMQFNRGHMTEHMICHTVGQLWDTIKVKFKKDVKGLYYNERLENEKIKRSLYTASRRNNILGKNQYSDRGHTTTRMEDENINENESKNKKNTAPTFNDVFKYCQERKNNIDPQMFMDFYEANGWVQGRGKPIKSWKACVRTWEKRDNYPEQDKLIKPVTAATGNKPYKHFNEK